MPLSLHSGLPSSIQAVAIVDPTSGGHFIAERLETLGIPVLRLRSDAELDEGQKSLLLQANRDAVAIVPGAESGVIAAEKWAREYGLRGNDPASSAIRRNKHRMAEALSSSGVAICRQALHAGLNAAEEWADRVGYPVVVKPPESSGSDLVRICHDREEFRRSAQLILTGNTKYGAPSEGVIVQEFMNGDEYTVDGVVFEDRFVPFAAGRYKKMQVDGGFVYDLIEFFAPNSSDIDESIVAYAHHVVKALNVTVGPVHIEIMLTERGPLLVELAARPHGGIGTAVIDASFEPRFTDAIISSYLGGQLDFAARISPISHSIIFFLKNSASGIVKNIPGKQIAGSLASYMTLVWFINDGDRATRTVDLSTCPALIHLANADYSALQFDVQKIRSLEELGELIMLEVG